MHGYQKRAETAVAEKAKGRPKIELGPTARYSVKMMVAQRFHIYCHSQGILADERLPYGFMKTFMKDNILWKAKQKALTAKKIRQWYQSLQSSSSNEVAALADQPLKAQSEKSVLGSRAPLSKCQRVRAPGGGRHHKVPLLRQALYEWWSSMRYAIEWKQLAANRRSRGKKNLARFPRSLLRVKVHTPGRHGLPLLAERLPRANCHSRFVVVQKMGRVLRLIHAKGEQEIPGTQRRAKRAPRNLLGRLVQNQAVHFLGLQL